MFIAKKIQRDFFEAVIEGRKSFELRKEDDVTFCAGDLLALNEYVEPAGYTGRCCLVEVSYVLRDFEGLSPGYAVVGFRPAGVALASEDFRYGESPFKVPLYERRPESFSSVSCD